MIRSEWKEEGRRKSGAKEDEEMSAAGCEKGRKRERAKGDRFAEKVFRILSI